MRNDKITSVSLIALGADKPQYQIRIATQEFVREGKESVGLTVHLPTQPKQEAERQMFQIMEWITRKL